MDQSTEQYLWGVFPFLDRVLERNQMQKGNITSLNAYFKDKGYGAIDFPVDHGKLEDSIRKIKIDIIADFCQDNITMRNCVSNPYATLESCLKILMKYGSPTGFILWVKVSVTASLST